MRIRSILPSGLPLLLLSASLTVSACQSQLDDKPKAEVKDAKGKDAEVKDAKGLDSKAQVDSAVGDAKKVALDGSKSSIGFVGAKVTGDHEGTFEKVEGTLTLDGDTPSKIEVTVQTGSTKIEPEKLQAHLLSDDFFDAANHPTSTFVSSEIRSKAGEGGTTHEVEGDLSLRGTTKTITFPATVKVEGGEASGKAEFTINRKDFGIVYDGMADDLIKDDVLLKLDLHFPLG